MQEKDPLAVIAQEAPCIPDEDAIAIAKGRYGLDVTVKPLISERDQNFRMRAADGSRYVMKIANAAEDPVVTDFQVQALLYIENRVRQEGIPVVAPKIVPTLDGRVSFRLSVDGVDHVVRVVTYIEGKPLAHDIPSPALARSAGECLAQLGRALHGFEHPGSNQSLLWDLQRALGLRDLIEYVRDPAVAEAVGAALADYERHALPVLPTLRAQVIHSDLNSDNLVVREDDNDRVAGVIDFGDMLHAPLVADVAIGCSYNRPAAGDPLCLMSEFLAGYHSVTPLEQSEVDILFELIQARICASVTILDWRAALRGSDDPYLAAFYNTERSTGDFLLRLREIPRACAITVFRQVCASAEAGGQALS